MWRRCACVSQETDAAARLLLREPPPPMKVREVRPALTKALKGGTLAPTELLSPAELLCLRTPLQSPPPGSRGALPQLAHYAHQLHPLQPLERQIHDCIDPNGEVRDSASENLARIRNDQRRLQKRITERTSATHSRMARLAAGADLHPPCRTLLPARSD